MNFDDTAAEAAFRARARSWINSNAPTELAAELANGTFGTSALKRGDILAASKAWQKKKAAAGWACLHWPKEYGGVGATPIERVIWQQEEGVYIALTGVFVVGHGMCGPTLIAHGSEEQKRRFLPPLAAGDEIWCQLFSEPAAGSDLAGLRTRARLEGNQWVINGQKIWTSGAQICDYGLLLARSDPSVPKHKGLTMFCVDMKSPGVEVRPIKQANGDSGFNEVYFADVRIPDSQRVGEAGEGWKVALSTLMNERLSLGGSMGTNVPALLSLCHRVRTAGGLAIEDRTVRSRVATWFARANGLKYTGLRAVTSLSQGKLPGPENSIGKLVAGSLIQDVAMFALDLQGPAGVLVEGAECIDASRFQAMLLRSPGIRIEGGTDEILRNIIAERVLGLPPDIRLDKDLPFDQVPTGGKHS